MYAEIMARFQVSMGTLISGQETPKSTCREPSFRLHATLQECPNQILRAANYHTWSPKSNPIPGPDLFQAQVYKVELYTGAFGTCLVGAGVPVARWV